MTFVGVLVQTVLLFGAEPFSSTDANNGPTNLAPNDPALASHLQLWLRADALPLRDGAQVFRWPDQSRHNRDASPTMGVHEGVGTPPTFLKSSVINGRPAVRFSQDNGLGTPGDRPVDVNGDAAFTVFVVANLKYQEGPSRDVIVGFGEALNAANTTPGRPGAGLLEIDRTPEGRHRLDHAGGFKRDALVGRPGSFASFYDQPQVITLTKRPGPMRDTSSILINGEAIDTVSASGTTASPDIRHRADFSVVLGHAHAVTGSLSGDIAEVIIYNRALPEAQRLGVEQHLAAKYGITPSLFEDRPGPELVTGRSRQHWAFKKLVRPSVPGIPPQGSQTNNPIDAFLLEKLAAHGLTFSPRTDPETLLRRLYLDLIGLPPSPEEIRDFCEKASPEACEQVVDALLQSRHFGERWGRHWLDLVGYVDVTGNDQNAEQIILGASKWRYRDYVIRAFNGNKPWDRFLTEQIAGDELSDWRTAERFTDEDRELLIATGYLRTAIDDTHEVDLNKVPFRYQVIYDTVQITGASLFGLTLQCARCHDHKFDPIPQRDYYRLMALFTPALNAYAWLQPKDREVPDVSTKEQAAIYQHNAALDRRIKPFAEELARIRGSATNKVLDSRLSELPETNRSDVKAAFIVPAEKRNGTQKELLKKYEPKLSLTAEELEMVLSVDERIEVESLEGNVAVLTKQKQSWDTIRAFFESGPPPRDFIFRRGDYEQRGQRVGPGLLAVLCRSDTEALLPKANEAKADSSGRRLDFARWLTDTNGAPAGLHARVWMNRCWQQLFGDPLVPTPDNFGVSGLPPTDPALLDWLACEFIESGWQLKHMIKLMVMSSAYRQSSVVPLRNNSIVAEPSPFTAAADSPASSSKRPSAPASEETSRAADASSDVRSAATIDPENRLLWRQRMRRLESEIVRDTVLAVSGKLDKTMFGPAVPIVSLPDGSAALASDDKMPTPTSKWRRSIYLLTRRNFHLPILGSFDQPIINTTCPRRMSSSAVLQPFTMLNDSFVVEQASSFAERVAAVAPDSRKRIEQAFLCALGRKPAAEEVKWSLKFLASQSANFQADTAGEMENSRKALAALCQMLFNTSEFLYAN